MSDFLLNPIKLLQHFSIALKCWQKLLIFVFFDPFLFIGIFSKDISLILKFYGVFLQIIWKEVVLVFVNDLNVFFWKSPIRPGQSHVNWNDLIDKRLKFWLIKGSAVWGHVECVFFNVELLFWLENEFQDVFDVALHQDFILHGAVLSEGGFVLNHFEKFVGH